MLVTFSSVFYCYALSPPVWSPVRSPAKAIPFSRLYMSRVPRFDPRQRSILVLSFSLFFLFYIFCFLLLFFVIFVFFCFQSFLSLKNYYKNRAKEYMGLNQRPKLILFHSATEKYWEFMANFACMYCCPSNIQITRRTRCHHLFLKLVNVKLLCICHMCLLPGL
jgi:hypothetical protein